jgi:predicted NBD/HSP70 family sugar kinase
MPLPANGATIGFRSRLRTSLRGRPVSAAAPVASKPICPVPGWRASLAQTGGPREIPENGRSEQTAADVALAADRGDLACEQALARYEHRLASALAQVVNIGDQDVIVLGGGLSNSGGCTSRCRAFGPRTHSRIRSQLGSCAIGTAIPAACAVQPGWTGSAREGDGSHGA